MRFRKKRSTADTASASDRAIGPATSGLPLEADTTARLGAAGKAGRVRHGSGAALWRRLPRTGRVLAGVWAGLIATGFAAAATLAWLGPEHAPTATNAAPKAAAACSAPNSMHASGPMAISVSPDTGSRALPRSAPPVKAMPVRPAGPVVVLLIDGVGFSDNLTRQALTLPPEIGVILSPYLANAPAIADAARAHGHAVLLSLPMQPSHGAQDDEGPHALGGTHTPQDDEDALTWALSRLPAPDGVTDAASGMTGGAFVSSPDFAPIARRIEDAHLTFVEAEPGRARTLPGATADIAIDGDADAATIDHQLAMLAETARRNGHALGVTTTQTPMLLDRIALWSQALTDARLAPVATILGRADLSPLSTVAVAEASLPPRPLSTASPAASVAAVPDPAPPMSSERPH